MPAALAIAPLPGTIAVKTTSEPAVPAIAEGFGQVLRSVWGAATVAVSAAAGAAQGQLAPADPDLGAVAIEETTAGQAAAMATVPTERAATPHTAVPTAKPAHSGKENHYAAVDSGASTPASAVVPEAETTPTVVANPAIDPSAVAVPNAPVPSVSAAVSAGVDRPAAVPAALAAAGPGGDGTPVQGAVPSRSAKGPVTKEKANQGTSSAQAAPDVAPTAPVPTQLNPVETSTAAAGVEAAHPATDSVVSAGPVGSGGGTANGETPLGPASGLPGSGGQAAPAIADTSTLPQPMPGAGSDVPGQLAVPVSPCPPLPTAAVETASPAVPAGDHKITLRPVEAGADPAKPAAVPPGSAQQPVVAMPAATPAVATPTAAVVASHQAALASPVQQLAPALLTLAKTADGGQQMTVRLHPAELGMVQVRIAQVASGAMQVDITADNPATLLALQRDQPQLHRALDDAGIAAAGRTVTFHVAQPAQAVAGVNTPASANGHGTGQQGSAGRTNTGTTDADGSAGGGRGSYAARERIAYPTSRRSGAPAAATGTTGRAAGTSYRIGLDITA